MPRTRRGKLVADLNMGTMRRNTVCPHCKRPWAQGLRIGGARQQAMIDYLDNHPDGASVRELMGAVYANDPDGGPDDPVTMRVMKYRLNKLIAPLGWRIVGRPGGPGSKYYLVCVES